MYVWIVVRSFMIEVVRGGTGSSPKVCVCIIYIEHLPSAVVLRVDIKSVYEDSQIVTDLARVAERDKVL